MMNLPIFLIFISLLTNVCCQSACNTKKSCGECIGNASERCIWCSQEFFNQTRCQPIKYKDNLNWCKGATFIPKEDPLPDLVQNENFSSTVQFRPQKVTIKASPGVFVNLTVSYKSAKDFPLDVYFLMDFSYTMKNHSEALKQQAMEIFNGLKNLTNNVLLGVGSFIEKPVLPYVDIIDAKQTAYVFKNHLSLTDDMKVFANEITNYNFGSNYDDAEAGLDALMQVMTCEKVLGWRNNSRRIIVLVTDAIYHSAGDGKMLGAIKPNDMKCHLNGNEYDPIHALIHDYPSVGQINKVATNGNFKIIFAALLQVKTQYEALAKHVLGAKYSQLKNESNIVKIIKAAYEESIRKVELRVRSKVPAGIQVNIDQDCQSKPTINCDRSPLNPVVSIPVSIKSTVCPEPGAAAQSIIIGPVGLNDKLEIKIEVDCECACEKNVPKVTTPQCSDMGVMQCGACKCNADRGGDRCEFDCTDAEVKDFSKCMEPNSTKVCNDHGYCRCGSCLCKDGFSGDFCQYHDGLCSHKYDKVCSGHGDCMYGKCVCYTGWEQDAICDCPKGNQQCIAPFSTKVCSGRGTCTCGKCNCVENSVGLFCDSCDNCANERCEELKDYAHCNLLKEKYKCDEEYKQEAEDIEVNLKNTTEFNAVTATKCKTELPDGTFLLFKYQINSGSPRLTIIIQKEVELPPKANIWIPIGSAIGAILLIGLLTAIGWKILVDIYDKKEYEKFCTEAKSQGYDVSQNPIYDPPVQNFVNPGFNQQCI